MFGLCVSKIQRGNVGSDGGMIEKRRKRAGFALLPLPTNPETTHVAVEEEIDGARGAGIFLQNMLEFFAFHLSGKQSHLKCSFFRIKTPEFNFMSI